MLTSKQRAYLRAMANSIETILMVGKGGISDDIVIGTKFILYRKNQQDPKIVLPKSKKKSQIGRDVL